MKNIYLDASATTPPHIDVINKLQEIQSECWGNPSSIHKIGVIARDILEDAKMGRRYLPGIWIQNISPKEIVLAAETNDLKKIHIISKGVKKLLILAEQYYFSGERGFIFLPFKTRVAISIASGVYREIGVQLENENYNWQNGRQVTSVYKKIKISLFKTFKEIFYFRLKKKHNSKLHIFLENLVDDK